MSPLKLSTDPVDSMNALGTCLTKLMSLKDIEEYQHPNRLCHPGKKEPVVNGFRLHSARHCTNSNLIALTINLKGGVPQAYDILRCGPHVTKYDLEKFFRRARLPLHQHQPSFILEVNKLAYHVQQVYIVIMSCLAAWRFLCCFHYVLPVTLFMSKGYYRMTGMLCEVKFMRFFI